MQNKEGLFVVIEGVDGAGKGTQFKLLIKRLELAGYDVATFDFPRYEEPSSYFVKQYLNGAYGDRPEAVSPYTASLFFALDRFAAAPQIREALGQGKVVLANRFTGSSMAAQGTKFDNADERRGYFIWLDNLEFEMLKIPRPDVNLVLRVPADIAQAQVDKKDKRAYTDKKRDLHEADGNLMRHTVEVYDDLCQLFPRDFVRVDCARGGKIMPIEMIGNLVWEKVFPFLPRPTRPRKSAKTETASPASLTTENPYVEQVEAGLRATDMGQAYLDRVVTDPVGPVYGFTNAISPVTVAAAMARLCRRSDDLRITLLDEFPDGKGTDEQTLRRAVVGYGDDSVQQLIGVHMVVEGASNLLTKKLEWGRLGTYLEQSTRYLYFDQKDENGQYKYYVPDHFDTATKQRYRELMDVIFGCYADMVHRLTEYIRETSSVPRPEQDEAWQHATRAQACDAVRPVLPVATKSTVGMLSSAQSIENLVVRLMADELPEARRAGKYLLEQARQLIPAFLERIDMSDRGQSAVAYRTDTAATVSKLARELLPDNHADSSQTPADLVDVWPRNELAIVPDILYEHGNLPLRELQRLVETWPYEQKAAVFAAYMGKRDSRRDRPGRALEKIHYAWDIMCDYGIFRELQRHRMVDDLTRQQLTPRYGYEVPKVIEAAGLADQFEVCFDTSLQLYSILVEAGYPLEAQYATLLGHRMRWKVTYNAREAFHLHELRTTPQAHPSVRKLVNQMHEIVAGVHPLLASAMRFVDTTADPELSRLSTERRTQAKLRQMGENENS